jgi:hypothetical protein
MLISTFIVFTLGLGGIFLLLGYSSTDEALLRPHTNLGVQDAVRALQQYVSQHVNNKVSILIEFWYNDFTR